MMRIWPLWILTAGIAAAQSFTLNTNFEEQITPLFATEKPAFPTLESVAEATRALESRSDLTDTEREREQAKLQRDYELALQMLEWEKAREARRGEAEKQGREFTRLYLQLDMTDSDFAEKFQNLLERFPLAQDEPLSRKLIERARRFIEREKKELDETEQPKASAETP